MDKLLIETLKLYLKNIKLESEIQEASLSQQTQDEYRKRERERYSTRSQLSDEILNEIYRLEKLIK